LPTLKQAQSDPKAMKQFMDEHADLEVEGERFERVIQSMAGQETPSKGPSDDFLDGSDDYT